MRLHRLSTALLATVAAMLLVSPAGATARTYHLRSIHERDGVFTFAIPHRLRGQRISRARLRVEGRNRRISSRAIRRAARRGTLHAKAPAIVLRRWVAERRGPHAAAARRHHAWLRIKTPARRPAGAGNSGQPNGSAGSSPGSTPTPAPAGACSGTFHAGRWPGACWRPYSSASPFNKQIPAGAKVASGSDAMVRRLLGFGSVQNLTSTGSGEDWSHPTYYADGSDPVYRVHCTESWGTCAAEGQEVHIPSAAKPASGGDAHMTVVDQTSGWEYDFWQVQSKPAGGGTVSISWGGRTRSDGDGLDGGATASGFGTLAGIIRGPELQAGQIDHALFMVIRCDNGQHVYPAVKGGARCSDTTDAPPMGTRFQLDMSDAQIDALNVPAYRKTILRAAAHYGMYFGDTGSGSWALQFESGRTYTSFGATDPIEAFGASSGAPTWDGQYVFNVRDGVDWSRYLRVIDPCTTKGTC